MNPKESSCFTTEGEMISDNAGDKIFNLSHSVFEILDDGSCDGKQESIQLITKTWLGEHF
jgi:hypothetical protein